MGGRSLFSRRRKMVLIETAEDVQSKIKAIRRQRSAPSLNGNNSQALETIISDVISIVNSGPSPRQFEIKTPFRKVILHLIDLSHIFCFVGARKCTRFWLSETFKQTTL